MTQKPPYYLRLALVILCYLPICMLAQIPEGYYDPAQGLTGNALKSALHDIISDHISYSYTSTSTDVWDILKDADEDPDSSDNVLLIYTGRSQPKTANSGESSDELSNLWNREHLWSKSHGFPNEADTAFTDCHHLRPADESVNSSRSTLDFDNGGTQHVEATDCYYDGDSWEPRDAVKGDIARAMLYMVVRYDPGYHTDNTVYDLELVDYTGTQTYEPLFGKLSTLLQWHAQDPVDGSEIARNEVIFGYQGNRNPFIDHPEYVAAIFNEQLGSQTQVGFTGSSHVAEEDVETISIDLAIINPDVDLGTECLVSLTAGSGTADDLNGFESATVIFPAGSTDLQSLLIDVTDDDLAEDRETFIFTITSISGGDSATVNGNDTFVLTLNPSDQQTALPGLIISEVMDGNRPGGSPKFIEITNISTQSIPVGGLQIWRGSNGSDPGRVLDITTGALLVSGASWVIAYSSGDMFNAGFSTPDQSSGAINGNGNDVYELRTADGALIDAFGLVGTTTPWYENSVAERLPSVNGSRSSFNPAEWQTTVIQTGDPSNGSPGTPGFHTYDPVVSTSPAVPAKQRPIAVFPNPFNGQVQITYSVSSPGSIQLELFDLSGQLVQNLKQGSAIPGEYHISWSGTNGMGTPQASGIYILRLSQFSGTQFQRVTLLR